MKKDQRVNRKARRQFLNGTFLSLSGNHDKAISLLSKAIDQDPANNDARLNRGIAFLESDQLEQAIVDFIAVIQADPAYSLAYYNRSLAYVARKENDRALADIEKAIVLEPDNPDYYNYRCILYTGLNDFDRAISDASKAIELGEPKSGHNNRAIVYQHMGDLQSAEKDWTEVLKLAPGDPKALCSRGIIRAKLGNESDAIADLRRGLKKKSSLPTGLRAQSEQALHKLTSS